MNAEVYMKGGELLAWAELWVNLVVGNENGFYTASASSRAVMSAGFLRGLARGLDLAGSSNRGAIKGAESAASRLAGKLSVELTPRFFDQIRGSVQDLDPDLARSLEEMARDRRKQLEEGGPES